jgi:hypothetical protein
MTGSPGDEIVVSLGPPDSKKSSHRSPSPPPPLPPTEPVQSAEEPMPDAEASSGHDQPPQQDEVSRKSFKRKYRFISVYRRINMMLRYRKLLNKYLTIRANNQTLHQTYELAVSTASQLSNENAYPPPLALEKQSRTVTNQKIHPRLHIRIESRNPTLISPRRTTSCSPFTDNLQPRRPFRLLSDPRTARRGRDPTHTGTNRHGHV